MQPIENTKDTFKKTKKYLKAKERFLIAKVTKFKVFPYLIKVKKENRKKQH